MPVVSGLATKYDYRCDGSNGTGGLQPGEMIAMAAVSIANNTYGKTEEKETELFQAFEPVAEEWIDFPVPSSEDHSMILLPYDGYNGYIQYKDATTGEFVYELAYGWNKKAPSLTVIPELEEGQTLVEYSFSQKNSVGIKVTPIIDREESIALTYEKAKNAWTEEHTDENGKLTEEITAKQISEWKIYAERNTPCVKLTLETIDEEFVHLLHSVPKTTTIFTDETVWTPAKLDTMGFLSVLNTVWPS